MSGMPARESYRFVIPEWEVTMLGANVDLRREKVAQYDRRTFVSPEEHDERLGHLASGKWLDRGTEHVVLPEGGIRRRMPDSWETVVAFADLGELLQFVDVQGWVAIDPPEGPEGLPKLRLGDA